MRKKKKKESNFLILAISCITHFKSSLPGSQDKHLQIEQLKKKDTGWLHHLYNLALTKKKKLTYSNLPLIKIKLTPGLMASFY